MGSENLKEALREHEAQRSPQSHLRLLQALNTSSYLAPAMDDSVKYRVDEQTGEKIIDPESRFQLLMARGHDGNPLLVLFTDAEELSAWGRGKNTAQWRLGAQEAWSFAQGMSLGVIVNPLSAAWVMGPEHIKWLQEHPL